MTVLADGQYELLETTGDASGFVFGRGTKTLVSAIEHGAPDIVGADVARQQADGVRFGRDYRSGRTLTLDMVINTHAGDGQQVKDELEAAWLADRSRTQPGVACALRYHRGEVVRRVYGRPRKIAVTSGAVKRGWIPATCEFATQDHLFYDDDEQGLTIPIAPSGIGGFVLPVVFPFTMATSSAGTGEVSVAGTVPTWVVLQVRGPIAPPIVVEAVGRWRLELNATLAYDDWVTIDPRPWSRGVTTRFGRSLAGKFTADSPKLSELKLPPGAADVVLRGVDPSGRAQLTVTWRGAHTSF